MNYSIQKGDTLWSIVKNNYNLTNNTDIANKVNELAKANNIKDVNTIFAGQSLNLGGIDDNSQPKTGDNFQKSRVDAFDDWTNSQENYNDFLNGSNGGEFQMFKFNASSYSSDLKAFAQEYIDKFDEDKDGNWNKEEFIRMASNGRTDLSTEEIALYEKAFEGLNLDDDDKTISSSEFASQLYMTDLDINNYIQTGDIASSLNGKFSFEEYQTRSGIMPGDSGFDTMKKEKLDFFNNFYNQQ